MGRRFFIISTAIFGFCLVYCAPAAAEVTGGQKDAQVIESAAGTDTPRFQFKSPAPGLRPSRRPDNSVSAVFCWSGIGRQCFRLHVWREGDGVWMEVEPQSAAPFICGPDFAILQNGIHFDDVKLETADGYGRCGEVHVKSIFRLTQWSFSAPRADLNRSFTLLYRGATPDEYRINIPPKEPQ